MDQLPDCPVSDSLNQFNESLSDILSYLSFENKNHGNWRSILRDIYNHLVVMASNNLTIKKKILLPTLYTDNFDDEQIWQQIELINDILAGDIDSEISKKLVEKSENDKKQVVELDETLLENGDDTKDDSFMEEAADITEELSEYGDELVTETSTENQEPLSFNESDMLKFCEEMEKEKPDGSDDEEDVDDVVDIFGEGNDKADNCIDEEESRLEKELRKMQEKISANEEEALQEKPWHMLGESSQKDREKNALLEEDLQFEHGIRPAPEITVETTNRIEKLIIDRIKSKLFDDVERKAKPVGRDKMKQYDLPLNQEKSKLSLAEVYEKDYIEAQEKATGTEQEKVDENEEQIKIDLNALFRKLDALSNFTFAPKSAKEELKIIVDAPAITMEEAMPTAVADSQILAPGEVKSKQKEELRSNLDETSTDRKRKRRKIKKSQSIRSKEREIKKLKMERSDSRKIKTKADVISAVQEEVKQGITLAKKSSLKVGNNFFSQLQESVSKEKTGNISVKKKSKESSTRKFNKF